MLQYIRSLEGKVFRLSDQLYGYVLMRRSGLFDPAWYLAHNPDVAQSGVNPYFHFLRHGGTEGRAPGPGFDSAGYLAAYPDVRLAGLNPLVHYLRHGRAEGRLARPLPPPPPPLPYACPVCGQPVQAFLPLAPYYTENLKQHGFPYKPEEGETVNFEQYACPHCSANDRDRLTALYLKTRLPARTSTEAEVRLLDIAPSLPLSRIFTEFKVNRQTADLFNPEADLQVDITHMPEVASASYDILICSHVLEHVPDDRQALRELYRVLKPGGWGILMVPIILTLPEIDEDPQVTDEAERWRRFGQFDHVRLYNKAGFVARMEEAGFFVRQLAVQAFGETAFQQAGLTLTSVLYVAEKKPTT